MSDESRKDFGPIRGEYTFFQQHSTEAEADLKAYVPHLRGLSTGNDLVRMLDFGCGDGGFTASFLDRAGFPREHLRLCLVEPVASCLSQAAARLRACTGHPLSAWPALPSHLAGHFDLILSNHVLYYVPDITGTLSALLRAMSAPGLFMTAMSGKTSALIQYCLRCFDLIGKPSPFWLSEDCESALVKLGVDYVREEVAYDLVFSDSEENRLSLAHFLMGDDYHTVPRQALLEGFDSYSQAGQIVMRPFHMHFTVRR